MDGNFLEQWQVEYNSGLPVYRQIINQASAAVAAGTFKPGDQLPTIRALSGQLNVNPNTVAKAYRELELKGIIVSERGSGSFIQAQSQAPVAKEKKAALKSQKKATFKNLYHRLLADAASYGLTESELLNFIKEKNTSNL
jgi:GntR family transcriptional regulator